MPKTVVYDTRFFLEHYYSRENSRLQKTKEAIQKAKERFISAIVLHEIYWLTLEQEGQETATIRAGLLEKDFKVVKIDAEIAKNSAQLRHKYRIGIAESIIAATAQALKATCLSDDPNFKSVDEITTSWI
ncbi:MAG: type II toxin-antitoxin system VapC family toxin [Crenarchaeota archaeon]|nr:type II toxin-antitoxin system VapC family toxin [Thermoproteota archaeon]